MKSPIFSAGMCCRFPRIMRIRYDKPVEEAMNISQLLDMQKHRLRLVRQPELKQSVGYEGGSAMNKGLPMRTGSAPVSKSGGHVDHHLPDVEVSTAIRGMKRNISGTVDEKFKISKVHTMETGQELGQIFKGVEFCVVDDIFQISAADGVSKEEVRARDVSVKVVVFVSTLLYRLSR
jgi:hypothetical protein